MKRKILYSSNTTFWCFKTCGWVPTTHTSYFGAHLFRADLLCTIHPSGQTDSNDLVGSLEARLFVVVHGARRTSAFFSHIN